MWCRLTLTVAVLALSAGAAQAKCFSRSEMIRVLKKEHGETIQHRGFAAGNMVEVYASPSGTYTIAVTNAKTRTVSCVIIAGGGWSSPKPKADPVL